MIVDIAEAVKNRHRSFIVFQAIAGIPAVIGIGIVRLQPKASL